MRPSTRHRLVSALVLSLLPGLPAAAQTPDRPVPPVNADAKAMVAFEARLKAFVDLHHRLEATIQPLSNTATAEQIDAHQAALERLVARERAGARPGDIFREETRALVRRRLAAVLATPQGPGIKAAINDENPGPIRLQINGRYPDEAPLSSVPPEVLQVLPPLPEELEYHFIARRLLLLDVHSRTVVDYMENALPR